MALQIGDPNATSGMTKAIFDELDAKLMTQDEKNQLKPQDLESIRSGWRKLAFAVSTGIINYLKANMEILGIEATGSVTTTVTGSVSGTNVTGTGTGTVAATQSGPTTGHVK